MNGYYGGLNGTTLQGWNAIPRFTLSLLVSEIGNFIPYFPWDSAPHANDDIGKVSLTGTYRLLSLAINNQGQHGPEVTGCKL